MKTLILSIILLASMGLQAASVEELQNMKLPDNRVIKITGHPDYPPVIWKEKGSDKLVGIAVEVVQKAFEKINVKVETINSGTWGRAQEEVSAGRVDMLLPPYKNDKRVKVYQYHKNPFLMDDTVILVKKGKAFKFENLSDLKNKEGTAIIHDSFGTEFDEYAKNLSIARQPKTEHCLKFLIKGRADYMVGGYNAALAVAAKTNTLDEIEVLPKRVIVTGMYLPISFKSKWDIKAIHDYINDEVQKLHKSGEMKKLEKKYLEKFKMEAEKK